MVKLLGLLVLLMASVLLLPRLMQPQAQKSFSMTADRNSSTTVSKTTKKLESLTFTDISATLLTRLRFRKQSKRLRKMSV